MIYYMSNNNDTLGKDLKNQIDNLDLNCPKCPENPACPKCPECDCPENKTCPACPTCPSLKCPEKTCPDVHVPSVNDIVDGDVRFTSGQHGSDSAILLEDTGDANSLFDAAVHSRFPIANDLQSAVAAKLPDKVVTDPRTGVESPNTAEMAFDDGNGFIRGACYGKLYYSTGNYILNIYNISF